MDYGLFDFLYLIGSLAVFIFGMKTMSNGLQRAAGNKMKSIMSGMTSNRVFGVITGFILTVVLQTSSGATVMVVSFVNAGLLTLVESMGVIMGANIGTTLTAWMIYLFGYEVDILKLAIPAMGLVLPFYFGKNKLRSSLAEFVIGFGVLFIGIDFMKDSVPNIEDNPEMLAFIEQYTQHGFWSVLLFILFGTILTISVQSSSAASAITLALIAQGYIDFTYAAAIFLGENIGTTITANLAALVGNVHAKRAARFHLIFNIIGVTWVLLIFSPFLNMIDGILAPFEMSPFSDDIETRGINMMLGVSMFHSFFNIGNMLLFIGFLPFLERFVIWMQPSKGEADEEYRLKYITSRMGHTPELSLLQSRRAIALFAKLTDKMSTNLEVLLQEKHKRQDKVLEKIAKREEITDNMELEIADYLTRISEYNLSHESSRELRSYLSIINDLERVGDIYYEISKNFSRMKEEDIPLPEEALQEINDQHALVEDLLKHTRKNIENEHGPPELKKAYELEDKIDQKRKELRRAHFERLEQGIYSSQAGVIYLDFITRLEKIGDHLLNVNQALTGGKTPMK